MSDSPTRGDRGLLHGPASFGGVLRRFFFYGWMFRDAGSGSGLERMAAFRHNRDRARWLPLYMWRWAIVAVVTSGLARWCERAPGPPLLTAVLVVALILIVLFLCFTVVCWIFLRAGGRGR